LIYYRPGEWQRATITDQNEGVVHGLLPWDADGDGRAEVLTAGRLGIHLHRHMVSGDWSREALSVGVPEPYPDGGSSDLAAGTIEGAPMLAAIEPFHGNNVVVYRQSPGREWQRSVIDTELVNGHSLAAADFDGDGNSEIVAAGTRGPKNVYLYRTVDGATWQRVIVDDDISANSCTVGDINADGRIDLACIDASSPFNLKWYENTGDW
ncbi:MAG: VCBS repeat-containing protein, partial [Gammaproteobacteria bacterium]|nr:VCBS repeat-containing protein [Gammaproteobacteria bacterium]